MSLKDFKNPWGKVGNEYDKWFTSKKIYNEDNDIISFEEIAAAAESLGKNTIIMESYMKLQENVNKWFFSKNPDLTGKYKKPKSLKTWNDWNDLDSMQRQVICNLNNINPNTLNENKENFNKIIAGYNSWPSNLFAIFWGDKNYGTWTCNIFVGEALYWAGKSVTNKGKYYSALQIHKNIEPFKKVEPNKLKRGNIVTFHNGGHTEIVTKSPLKFTFADDGFCSIGAGRADNTIGEIKCDSSFANETREIFNENNAYHSL